MLDKLRKEIKRLSDSKRAEASLWFFKTGEGQYGYGDLFLGLTVPQQRKIAVEFRTLPLNETEKLLHSKYHEERLIALFILVLQFKKANENERKRIFDFYLTNTNYINNWDLVDSSAHYIVGAYLLDKDKKLLSKLAKSESLWEKRIAVIATAYFINHKEYEETFEIAEILLNDRHDLIHKAVGWMLREVGKKCSQGIEEEFLKKHYKKMPRTMLRYALEHFSEEKRKAYLTGKV